MLVLGAGITARLDSLVYSLFRGGESLKFLAKVFEEKCKVTPTDRHGHTLLDYIYSLLLSYTHFSGMICK